MAEDSKVENVASAMKEGMFKFINVFVLYCITCFCCNEKVYDMIPMTHTPLQAFEEGEGRGVYNHTVVLSYGFVCSI